MKRVPCKLAVAAIVVLSSLAPSVVWAQNQDVASLRAQIQELEAQLTRLRQELMRLEQGTEPTAACIYPWSRDLRRGSTGEDVLRLQQFLNTQPGILVASSGAGSPGYETSYYGTLTERAVRAFQEAHAEQVLAPVGLSSGTGVFDERTRSVANQLCGAVAVQPTLPEVRPRGTEGDLDDFEVNALSARLSEGEQGAAIEFEVTAWNATVSIHQVNVLFEAIGTILDDRPWNFIDRVQLRRGSRVVQELDASSRDDWALVGVRDGRSVYRIRFRSFSESIGADDTGEFSIVVITRTFLDSFDLPQSFAVSIGEGIGSTKGIRGVDSAGVYHEAGDAEDQAILRFET